MEIKAPEAKDLQRKRRLKYGTNAVLLTVSVLGILVISYVFINRMHWRLDFTANRSFSLSQQTRDVLDSLDEKVMVRAFFRKQGDIDQTYIRRRVDDVLREYEEFSPHIDYQMIDPDLDVEETLSYGINNDGTIVFRSAQQRKDISQSALFNYPSLEEDSLPLFVGESLFTNALLAVTQQTAPAVCFLSGHGELPTDSFEADGLAYIADALSKENYQVRSVSFGRDADWAEICDVLVIAGAKRTFHEREDAAVQRFVIEGKKLVFLVDPEFPAGLRSTLTKLHVQLESAVVFDQERHFLLGMHYPVPVLQTHDITADLENEDLAPVFFLARPLRLVGVGEDPYQSHPLLTTSEASWGETELREGIEAKRDLDRDLVGPLTVGAVVTRRPPAADEEAEGDSAIPESDEPVAVVFGDSNFISNGLIQVPGNQDLFLNSLAWLVGSQEQLSIRPQQPDFRPLLLEPQAATVVSYLFLLVYPGMILIGGLSYWWRRKRL